MKKPPIFLKNKMGQCYTKTSNVKYNTNVKDNKKPSLISVVDKIIEEKRKLKINSETLKRNNSVTLSYTDFEKSKSIRDLKVPEEKTNELQIVDVQTDKISSDENITENNFYEELNPIISIALKYNNGTKFSSIERNNTTWLSYDNINDWIKFKLLKNRKYWLIYNDQFAKTSNGKNAHAKGILCWNDNELTWLIHSVPNYPSFFNERNISDIENSELIYGQSFICFRYDISALDNILTQLSIMKINKISSNNNLYEGFSRKRNKPPFKSVQLHENIYHFSQNGTIGQDFFDYYLEPTYKGSTFYVETWIRGNIERNNNNVIDIQKIDWKNGVSYDRTQDHSKYAFSNLTVYIGDINRCSNRGGGGIIIIDPNICSLFKFLIE